MSRAFLAIAVLIPLSVSSATKKTAPAELNLSDLEGARVHLRDYRGHIVVLNFWATWCGPCKEEMPMFASVANDWAKKDIAFIGASLDDRAAQRQIPDFLKQFGVSFLIWKGATADDLQRLGMGESVPDTAFIDENGAIFARVQGEIKKSELIERLEWAAGDRKAPPPKPLLRNL